MSAAHPAPNEGWPPWIRRWDDFSNLAPYVSQTAVRKLRLTIDLSDLPTDPDPAAWDREAAGRVYLTLRAQGLTRANHSWDPTGMQPIRDPDLLFKSKWGNCLDISLSYAALCLEVNVAPLLAITDRHAFVLVAAGRLHETPWVDDRSPLLGKDVRNGSGRLRDVGDLLAACDDGVAVPIDCLTATQPSASFEDAVAIAREHLRAEGRVHLVDVPWLHRQGGEYAPIDPEPGTPAAISRYVPGSQHEFEGHSSHAPIVGQLSKRSGVVALVGPRGQGKSAIARHIALDVELGAGWFLNASEPQTLVNGLATAEIAQRNLSEKGLSSLDRTEFALGALETLRQNRRRWVVVLDNADGDPALLKSRIPTPNDNQLVLVTTTNPDWASVPGVEVLTLPPLTDDEIATRLGTELVPLVRGKALLLHSFAALMRSTGLSGAEIAAHAPAPGVVPDELIGPATLWAALRASPDFDERRLELSRLIAYLPPDYQPRTLLERFQPGATETLELLGKRGCLTYEPESQVIRMHRLLGEAVRADLATNEPDKRDATVIRLMADSEAFAVLDDHGDLATVELLEGRVLAIDRERGEPDDVLGTVLHAVARLLELHGHTRRSETVFEAAERHVADSPSLLADCYQSRARTANQHAGGKDPDTMEATLREGLEWALRAEAIADEDQIGRCRAMRGLILKKLAAFPRPGEDSLELLQDALEVLEDADAIRMQRLPPTHPERARSRFNLAGIRIDLAKRQRARASAHLDEGEAIYTEVRRLRREIYARADHPHVAACVAGLALIYYYRATLLTASSATRTHWLREATAHASDALQSREIQEGSIDGEESEKVSRLLAKIAMARHGSPPSSRRPIEAVARETVGELERAPVRPLPPDARDLDSAIVAWICSPALAKLVAELGDGEQPPKPGKDLAPLLDWLDELSTRWDFRGGNERDLAVAEELPPESERLVYEAAHTLGLVGTGQPPATHYDHVLILGGLARACLARPLYAARLLADETIKAKRVTALGGYRELGPLELELAAELGYGHLTNELDVMTAGVRKAFGLGEPIRERGERSDVVGESWRVSEYATGDGPSVQVVAAPSSRPGQRANTADTYAWFATELGSVQPGERVLMITSDIYVRYQHADALRILALRHSLTVDALGIQPGDADERLRKDFPPHHYLQEVRSTIRALRALYSEARKTKQDRE